MIDRCQKHQQRNRCSDCDKVQGEYRVAGQRGAACSLEPSGDACTCPTSFRLMSTGPGGSSHDPAPPAALSTVSLKTKELGVERVPVPES